MAFVYWSLGTSAARADTTTESETPECASHGRFTLCAYLTTTQQRVLVNGLVRFALTLDQTLTDILGRTFPPPELTFYLFDTKEQYRDYAKLHSPANVSDGGYSENTTIVSYRLNNSPLIWQHEMVHAYFSHILQDLTNKRYADPRWPKWFEEGLAEYLPWAEEGDHPAPQAAFNLPMAAYMANALIFNDLIELPTLVDGSPHQYQGRIKDLFYAEAWSLVYYLLNHPALRTRIRELFGKFTLHHEKLDAVHHSLNTLLTTKDFETDWRRYFRDRLVPPRGPIVLFNDSPLDAWVATNDGTWQREQQTLTGHADGGENYFFTSSIPMRQFTLHAEVRCEAGTGGLLLGNTQHQHFPVYYRVDIQANQMQLVRVHTKTKSSVEASAQFKTSPNQWFHIEITVDPKYIAISADGHALLKVKNRHSHYSLFGVHVNAGIVHFRTLWIRPNPQ